ncbi:MAG: ABC transporter permease subunit [Gammaproteobacteria bacterium]|nr:ABC transporter permease subunit [Gammaproteobacteria bacterium]
MIFTIAQRELKTMFVSPLAWTVLAVVEFILAIIFLFQIESFMSIQSQLVALESAPGVTDIVIVPVLSTASIICLLVVPLLTMRLISEERRNKSIALLMSAPISMTEIVLGKYLGLLAFLAIMLSLIALMPLSLLAGADLDLGKFAAGMLGLFFMLGAFAAAGLYMSCVTRHPAVAAVSTFGLLLALWLIHAAGRGEGVISQVVTYLSFLKHYQALLEGIFDSSDIVYYLLTITAFLVFSIRRLDNDRLQR